jgi:2-keto-4-pentenoate hydratase/2-oxohepta-3-ene-1,7-dioic acid hydratase in catechol pathway
MLYCRFQHEGVISHGVVDGDRVTPMAGDLFGDYESGSRPLPLSDVRLLAPVMPRKILAAAVNYQSHVPSGSTVLKDEGAPAIPQLFLKPSSSIIGPAETIVLPAEARRVDAEGELVAVIGRTCRKVAPEQALEYVFGYTCGNDVSARHWQREDIQWWRAKGSDTFSPIGPVIATGLDPENIDLRTRVNGSETQAGNTRDLIHSLASMISFASRVMTLEPGDILFTGTPGEPSKLADGDMVEVEIDGIGVLRNPVTREEASGSVAG